MGLREAFVARPGCVLVSADYSQIEMRLMAHFSQDPALIDALQAPSNHPTPSPTTAPNPTPSPTPTPTPTPKSIRTP